MKLQTNKSKAKGIQPLEQFLVEHTTDKPDAKSADEEIETSPQFVMETTECIKIEPVFDLENKDNKQTVSFLITVSDDPNFSKVNNALLVKNIAINGIPLTTAFSF